MRGQFVITVIRLKRFPSRTSPIKFKFRLKKCPTLLRRFALQSEKLEYTLLIRFQLSNPNGAGIVTRRFRRVPVRVSSLLLPFRQSRSVRRFILGLTPRLTAGLQKFRVSNIIISKITVLFPRLNSSSVRRTFSPSRGFPRESG